MPLNDPFAPDHTNGAIAIRHRSAEVGVGPGADNSSEHSGRALNGVDARFIHIGELRPRRSSALLVGIRVEIESRHQSQFGPRLGVPAGPLQLALALLS